MRKFLITMMCIIMVVCFMPTVAMAEGESGGTSGLVSISSLQANSETNTYDKDGTNSAHLEYSYYEDRLCNGINDTSTQANLHWVKTVTITGINFDELTDSSSDMTALGRVIMNGRRTDFSAQFKDSIEVKFINCTFNQETATLQVYKIMPCNVTKYTFENCTFNQKATDQFAITLNVAETGFDSRAISYEIKNSSIDSSGRGINIIPGTEKGVLGSYNNPSVLIKNNTIKTGTNQEKHVAVQISGDWNSANLTADSKPLITISENNITAYAAVRIHSTMSGQGAKYVALLANNTLTAGTRTVVADGNNELTKEIAAHYNTVLGGSISEYYAASITVDGNTAYYDTLADAIANAANGNTVTLLKDVELTQKMTIGKSITIDGKGHTISAADGFTNRQDHLMLLQSNVKMKNVTLDSNEKAKGINTYGNGKSLEISFENVKMLNSLGNGLTAKGGTITLKNVAISGSAWNQSVDISASPNGKNGANLVVDRDCSFEDRMAVVFDDPGEETEVGTVESLDSSRLIVSFADETKDWAGDKKPYTKRVFTLTKVSTGGITIPTTPTDNVTNSGSTTTDNAATNADLSGSTSTSNGTTSATVDKTTADKIVDKAVENKSTEVVIDATANTTTAANSTTIAQVTIPTETLGAIAEKTEADVTIKTDVAEVKMDNAAAAAVSEQATGDTVQIVIEKVAEETDKVEFELKVVCSDGKVISNFNGGNIAVTVALPKAMAEKKVVCVYIDDNGHMSKVEGQKNADGTYTFVTGHFSSYAILSEEEADAAIAAQKEAIKNIKIKLTSKQVKTKSGKKGIKITWTAAAGDKVLDGVEVYRSTERYKGYGTEPFYTSTKRGNEGSYINTKSLKKGTKYYYRVRGYVLVDGQKVYTDYSTKAWRTVK